MLIIHAIVDKGLTRKNNDDRILLNNGVHSIGEYRDTVSGHRYLAAVADGVGGEKCGGKAAGVVLECMGKFGKQGHSGVPNGTIDGTPNEHPAEPSAEPSNEYPGELSNEPPAEPSNKLPNGPPDESPAKYPAEPSNELPNESPAEPPTEPPKEPTDAPLNEALIKKSIVEAAGNVLSAQAENAEQSKMATTLAGVYVEGNDLITFNIGDSRVYRLRNGLMRPLTRDHSVVQELLDYGYITEDEVMGHPRKNIITRAIGFSKDCAPDIVKHGDVFFPGDMLLICSDGLTDQVEEWEIENILNDDEAPLYTRVKLLIQLTHSRGGLDNVSVILIHKNEGGE